MCVCPRKRSKGVAIQQLHYRNTMDQQRFAKVCEEYLALATKEAELRDDLRDVAGRRKDLEDAIRTVMEESNVVEVPFTGFNIKMRERVTKKAPKKEQVVESLARKLGTSVESINSVYEELKSESRSRQVKAVRKGVDV